MAWRQGEETAEERTTCEGIIHHVDIVNGYGGTTIPVTGTCSPFKGC